MAATLLNPKTLIMFSQAPPFQELRELLKGRVNRDDFEKKWQEVAADFVLWESSVPARNTSELNIRLEFLERVCAAFPELSLFKDRDVVRLALANSGARDVGEIFICKTPFRRAENVRIIRRELTERFGILYTLETPDGSRFTQEFMD